MAKTKRATQRRSDGATKGGATKGKNGGGPASSGDAGTAVAERRRSGGGGCLAFVSLVRRFKHAPSGAQFEDHTFFAGDEGLARSMRTSAAHGRHFACADTETARAWAKKVAPVRDAMDRIYPRDYGGGGGASAKPGVQVEPKGDARDRIPPFKIPLETRLDAVGSINGIPESAMAHVAAIDEQAALLIQNGIETLGQLKTVIDGDEAGGGGIWHEPISGIGPERAKPIEEAVAALS